ncbi:MAG TPA: putative DNA binding domain-containing protein, partial [Chitinophagales bacterium]|nr:putative DNA binding domain-containing protein [Chitinophagales bacterium]
MREIDKILLALEEQITTGTYISAETDKIELKDLSGGSNWKELHKTVCAFLNTKGGIIIVGVKEDQKQQRYTFTGYNANNESKIKELCKLFTDDKGTKIDLSEYIRPDLIEVKPFLSGQICLIFIEKLPDELKYVFLNGEAWERRITGDHKIPDEKVERQKQLKDELKQATELDFVPNATLNDLDADKLNDFIIRLNTDKKVETLKADITAALSFLDRKKMIRNGNPTLLGMLVCGNHIFDFVGEKCELDAYFETDRSLANDQKIYKDNIIPLMENAWAFTFSKTGTGVSVERGGVAVYEYPEEVIRETINNALAHRDYTSNRFSILRVRNNEYIEIRNPGKFRQEQVITTEVPIKIRRIIPVPKAQNPNLADVLKAYKRWERRGIGMATLTNCALNNLIDVPFYRIYTENEIGLFIPKGKVLDANCTAWLNGFTKYLLQKTNGKELTNEQKTVLSYFYKSEKLNDAEKFTVNLTPDNNHFEVIRQLENWGLVHKHPISTIALQVYCLEPILKKTDFTKELRQIFGSAYDNLKPDAKEVLEAIYQQNEYGAFSDVSANLIGNHLYFRKNSSINVDAAILAINGRINTISFYSK